MRGPFCACRMRVWSWSSPARSCGSSANANRPTDLGLAHRVSLASFAMFAPASSWSVDVAPALQLLSAASCVSQ
ncbi:hypothetical protein OH76DRAFT_303729 [Lentinus brumalis]|uniref:Uncharacterized protein n=1 Tax=Lentinus brumalis TaxID=2498619 RepID=A0A371DGB7_9APHY|nr:hypothetical protein OH76DRAFT_303729 [Polyporus brumalis]